MTRRTVFALRRPAPPDLYDRDLGPPVPARWWFEGNSAGTLDYLTLVAHYHAWWHPDVKRAPWPGRDHLGFDAQCGIGVDDTTGDTTGWLRAIWEEPDTEHRNAASRRVDDRRRQRRRGRRVEPGGRLTVT